MGVMPGKHVQGTVFFDAVRFQKEGHAGPERGENLENTPVTKEWEV